MTLYSCTSSNSPLSARVPRSRKRSLEPATRSRTVLDTTVSPASASAATRRDVHGNAGDIVELQLDFASMEAAAHDDAELQHRAGNRGGAPGRFDDVGEHDRCRRPIDVRLAARRGGIPGFGRVIGSSPSGLAPRLP